MASFYNTEFGQEIICPYCGKTYEVTYDSTIIGDKEVDCYTDGKTQTFTCDDCDKKFKMTPCYIWRYETETIDGEMTEEEHEKGKKTDNLPSCNSCVHNGEWSSIGNCIKCRGFDRYERRD